MAAKVKHADHDYIVARQEKYLAAYRSGSPKAMMEWMDPQDLIYSDFGIVPCPPSNEPTSPLETILSNQGSQAESAQT